MVRVVVARQLAELAQEEEAAARKAAGEEAAREAAQEEAAPRKRLSSVGGLSGLVGGLAPEQVPAPTSPRKRVSSIDGLYIAEVAPAAPPRPQDPPALQPASTPAPQTPPDLGQHQAAIARAARAAWSAGVEGHAETLQFMASASSLVRLQGFGSAVCHLPSTEMIFTHAYIIIHMISRIHCICGTASYYSLRIHFHDIR